MAPVATNLVTANAASSQLIIVDIQTKLASAMPADTMQVVLKNCVILAQVAQLLNIDSVLTEQYPQGLGETLPEIKRHLANNKAIAKMAFSACGEPKFNAQLYRDKPQIMITGMEAHICVLQTALHLMQAGKTVFVVDRKSTRLNSSHRNTSRMPSSA